MNVLAIDTATPAPAVAVLTEGRVHEQTLPKDRRASEDLIPAIQKCLRRAALELTDCERIAVCSVRVLPSRIGFTSTMSIPTS